MIFMKNKKGSDIIVGNVVFIILALLFFGLLLLFLMNQSSSTRLMEERTAKEIALLLDSAEPGTEIIFDIEEIASKTDDEANAIRIENNFVYVKLKSKEGYKYHFFNSEEINYDFMRIDGRRYLKINVQ